MVKFLHTSDWQWRVGAGESGKKAEPQSFWSTTGSPQGAKVGVGKRV